MKLKLFATGLLALFLTGCCALTSAPRQVVLDVRTAGEFAAGHLQNAVLVPVEELSARIAETIPEKSTPIAVYCRSGRRSKNAAQLLHKLGYHNVTDLGGMQDAGKKLNLPIIQP